MIPFDFILSPTMPVRNKKTGEITEIVLLRQNEHGHFYVAANGEETHVGAFMVWYEEITLEGPQDER